MLDWHFDCFFLLFLKRRHFIQFLSQITLCHQLIGLKTLYWVRVVSGPNLTL
jgi:hypothetical protein